MDYNGDSRFAKFEWWKGEKGDEAISTGPALYTDSKYLFRSVAYGSGLAREPDIGTDLTVDVWLAPRKDQTALVVGDVRDHETQPPLSKLGPGALRGYGIVNRSRLSRREPYKYWLIMRRELNALKEATAPAKQKPLPYDVHQFSSKGNLTTREVKKTLPLSGKELNH